jgi:hypothetical protein
VTIFYYLRFETSLFVASYDSQGHGWGIRPRLHTGYGVTVKSKSKSHCDWRSVSQSVSLCVKPNLGLMTRYLWSIFLFLESRYTAAAGTTQKTHQLLSNGYHVLLSGVSTHALPSNGRPIVAHSLLWYVFTCLLPSNALSKSVSIYICIYIYSKLSLKKELCNAINQYNQPMFVSFIQNGRKYWTVVFEPIIVIKLIMWIGMFC